MSFTKEELLEAGEKALSERPWMFMDQLIYPKGVTPLDFDYEEIECRPENSMETIKKEAV